MVLKILLRQSLKIGVIVTTTRNNKKLLQKNKQKLRYEIV